MIKKALNQNAKYVQEIERTIESDFNFSKVPINRVNISEKEQNKSGKLSILETKINSIENCTLRNDSKILHNLNIYIIV